MFKHHFKIALRNLWKNRQSSIINAVGLSLGIALFLLIMEYVVFEKTANHDNKNFNNLYRLNVLYKNGKAILTCLLGGRQ